MANTTNFGWETPDDTDLVKDGALAMRTLGNAIDTSLVDLKGGTTGQNLRKNTNTDMDFVWAGDATNTVIDAEGDLLVGDSADTLQRLAIGTTGQVLTVDTTIDGKIKWAAAAAGGKILQVVQDEDTSNFATTSTSFVDTGLSVTITPSSASSKVMVYVSIRYIMIRNSGTGTSNYGYFKLLRGATQLQDIIMGVGGFSSSTDKRFYDSLAICYLDSPNTTSATTYKLQAAIQSGDSTNVDYYSSATNRQNIVVMEVGA